MKILIFFCIVFFIKSAFANERFDLIDDLSIQAFAELYKVYEKKWQAESMLMVCEKKGLISVLQDYDALEEVDKSFFVLSLKDKNKELNTNEIVQISKNVGYIREGFIKGLEVVSLIWTG